MVDNVRRSASHRNRATLGDLEPQAYLLDFSNYTLGSAAARTWGRDFQVLAAAECRGARLKVGSGTGYYDLRLYRVGDEALLASKDDFWVTGNETTELLFDTPVSLATGQTYVICIWTELILGPPYYNASDHPDGPVTVLTTNVSRRHASDAFPETILTEQSCAIEPIIYA